MPNKRSIWLIFLGGLVLLGTTVVALRAAAQAPLTSTASPAARAANIQANAASATAPTRDAKARASPTAAPPAATPPSPPPPAHPAASAPEESATITDDPTTAPDPSQSADNNVSFPNDI